MNLLSPRSLRLELLEDRAVPAQIDTLGTEFWLAFTENASTSTLSLTITSQTDANGTVSIPGRGFRQDFNVTAGTVRTVNLPPDTALSNSDSITDQGIHIVADQEVTVYGLNQETQTTDAFVGLPEDALGTDYLITSFNDRMPDAGQSALESQLAVVATQDATTVTIIPSATTSGRIAGVPYNITLNEGQTYFLGTDNTGEDLTGTEISADQPIAVFGNHQCADVPLGIGFCDHLTEQMVPTSAWSTDFVTVPLATRTAGDVFRVLAAEDNTTVRFNGSVVATLNRGQFYQTEASTLQEINADKPVSVTQFSKGSQSDGVTADPFMTLIPPVEQFLPDYVISTPGSPFTDPDANYVNLTVPTDAIATLRLDGAPVDPGLFTPIGSSGFSGAQLNISPGSHTLNNLVPFGVVAYGFASFDSYGYPGGAAFETLNGALNDFYSIGQDRTLNVDEVNQGLLTNDLDGGAPPVTIVDFDTMSASGGTVVVEPDGRFTYTPPTGFTGADTFRYTAQNARGEQDTALVTVTVFAAAPLPPTANPDNYIAAEDETLSMDAVQGLLANDLDGGAPPIWVVDYDLLSAHGGSIVVNPDGSFTYTPAPGFAGDDWFEYRIANELGETDTAMVAIQVMDTPNNPNESPIAMDDAFDAFCLVGVHNNVLDNDLDPDGDPLMVVAVDGDPNAVGQPTLITGGTLTLNPDGSFLFFASEDFVGQTSFSYTIADPENAEATATVTLTVPEVPNEPSVRMMDDVLVIVGTDRGDTILIDKVNYYDRRTRSMSEQIVVRADFLRWRSYRFAIDNDGDDTITGVSRIMVYTKDGHDMVLQPTNGSFDLPTYVRDSHGSSQLHLGSGDNIVCMGEGFDNIRTGGGNNYILTGNGGSLVVTQDGHDTVMGGDGFDNVETGGGHDHVDVADGGSQIKTGDGNDTVFAGDGYDNVELGAGDDYADIGAGGGIVKGMAGNDTLIGGSGSDRLEGGADHDLILGLAGNDFLDGQAGNDLIIGGVDRDDLEGGTDNDTLIGDEVSTTNADDDLIDELIEAMQTGLFINLDITSDHQTDQLKGETGKDTIYLFPEDRNLGDNEDMVILL